MIYIFLPYSLAFLALGFAMVMAARAPVPVLPRMALWFLAGFGLLHGLHEWFEMAILIQTNTVGVGSVVWIEDIEDFLTAISFACLMQAGIEILVSLKRWPKWTRSIPIGLLLVLAGLSLLILQSLSPFSSVAWPDAADAMSRYLLGFPGALLAAYAFLVASRAPREGEREEIKSDLTMAAAALVGYAVASGLIGPYVPFPPGSLINRENFAAVFHIPIEALRAFFALIMAWFLSEACITEAARTQAELDRLKDQFITVAAHELKTPVTGVKGYAQLLLQWEREGISSRSLKALQALNRLAYRLDTLINDLLEISQLQSGQLQLKKEPIALAELVRQAADQMSLTTTKHRILVLQAEPVVVIGDKEHLMEVIKNLLDNAIRYSPKGGDVDVAIVAEDHEAVVSVEDHGVGIPSEKQGRIFERFYRAHTGTSYDYGGMGVGLYVSREVIERQGGRMWFESEEGTGSIFSFSLPIKGNGRGNRA